MDNLYTVRDVAKVLGISPHTVRKWLRENRLPVIRFGRCVRFGPAAIDPVRAIGLGRAGGDVEMTAASVLIAGKTYRVEVIRPMPDGAVAFLIPCHNGFHLTKLAVDAIHAFTQDVPHEVWVIDNVSSASTRCALRTLGINLILNHTRPQPWWRRQIKFGSWANGVALEIASQVIAQPRPTAFFVMHNDALPIRAGWLTELVRSDAAAIAFGVKEDQHPARIHAMHVSGFFVPSEIAAETSFLPKLPRFDAGDRITARIRTMHGSVTTTPWHPHRVTFRVGLREPVQRPELCPECPGWLREFDCDVSTFTPGGPPFYVHKGGGSAMSRKEIGAWVKAAREALGLEMDRCRA